VACVAQPTFLFSQSRILNETLQETVTADNNKRLFGMVIALSCALSISMSIVLNKKLIQKNVRQSIIMFYFLFITCIILSIIQIYYWVFLRSKHQEFNFKKIFLTKDFIFASIISILQIVPMILAQKSIKREHPSIVTVVQSSDILFAIILQNVFSTSKTNLLAIIGSILVLTSIFIVGGHKLWLDRQNRTCIPTSIQENETKNNE
jgi:drug/metabolite transporter (DMT)-like permease